MKKLGMAVCKICEKEFCPEEIRRQQGLVWWVATFCSAQCYTKYTLKEKAKEGRSCVTCKGVYFCSFKPKPNLGSSSGGIMLDISYVEFRDKLLTLYGTHCTHYIKP